jgi:hypothetical protein
VPVDALLSVDELTNPFVGTTVPRHGADFASPPAGGFAFRRLLPFPSFSVREELGNENLIVSSSTPFRQLDFHESDDYYDFLI